MSRQIETSFVDMYRANVDQLVRQKGSRLRDTVVVEKIVGNQAYFEQIGSVVGRKKSGRHSDVEYSDTPHQRRRVATTTYYATDLIDREDKLRMLFDPASEYAEAQADALGKDMDECIIEAATATAYTGVDGTTATPFDSNMIVDVTVRDPGVTSGNYGLNVAKLLRAHRLLNANHVPTQDRYIVVNSRQMESLLSSQKATSADYASVKALVHGEIDTYCGFKFRQSEYIQQDASNNDKVLFYHKRGLRLGMNGDLYARISELPQKHYAVQVYSSIDIGCTRMQEGMVGYIACHPSNGPGA